MSAQDMAASLRTELTGRPLVRLPYFCPHGNMHHAPERPVFLRLAEQEGVIYLDLCDSAWRIVAISAQGWRVIASRDAPVRFRRTKGMLPLPEPQKGGSVLTLRQFLNVAENDKQAWTMIVAW